MNRELCAGCDSQGDIRQAARDGARISNQSATALERRERLRDKERFSDMQRRRQWWGSKVLVKRVTALSRPLQILDSVPGGDRNPLRGNL
jgi:hypothetical protein